MKIKNLSDDDEKLYNQLLGLLNNDIVDVHLDKIEKAIKEYNKWHIKYGEAYYAPSSSSDKTYASFHPDNDPLLIQLKNILNPIPDPTIIKKLLYRLEVFIRKYNNPSNVIFSKEVENIRQCRERALANDKSKVKHWEKFVSMQNERIKAYQEYVEIRKVAERSSVFKPLSSTRKH